MFDPCCGTGGFLIAAASAAQRAGGMSWEATVQEMAVNGHLLGIEVEGQTAVRVCVCTRQRVHVPFPRACCACGELASGRSFTVLF